MRFALIMTRQNISLLGSTGSIGCSTLDVIAHSGGTMQLCALAGHCNVKRLIEQAHQFRPKYVAVTNPQTASEVDKSLFPDCTILLKGPESLIQLAQLPEAQTVVCAVVGRAGLESTMAALQASKRVALANKESLVIGGELVIEASKKYNAPLLPIDSEHGAVFQSLRAGNHSEIKRVVLTASGGPFREYSEEQLQSVTLDQALAHPTWKMGKKITIDSATLMNKALEIVEARWLFNLTAEQIAVVIHPQSYVHSMVEFVDGSVIAQISPPDMRLPIQYALTCPERTPGPARQMDWSVCHKLDFFPPDLTQKRFKGLSLALKVVKYGGSSACVMNAANEIAVQYFIEGKIPFLEIVSTCCKAVDAHLQSGFIPHPTLEELIQIDNQTRQWTQRELDAHVNA